MQILSTVYTNLTFTSLNKAPPVIITNVFFGVMKQPINIFSLLHKDIPPPSPLPPPPHSHTLVSNSVAHSAATSGRIHILCGYPAIFFCFVIRIHSAASQRSMLPFSSPAAAASVPFLRAALSVPVVRRLWKQIE